MLSSSMDYLRALRQGQYLLFLEWPAFVTTHYAALLGAEDILALLVFEWLNNGFCEEDVKILALLQVVNQQSPDLFPSQLSYSLTSLFITALECMAYQRHHLQDYYLTQHQLTADEILVLMKANRIYMDEDAIKNALDVNQSEIATWVAELSPDIVKAVVSEVEKDLLRINSLESLGRVLEQYINSLAISASDGDPLFFTRFSLIRTIYTYLKAQSELTPDVNLEISTCVQEIRKMNPTAIDEKFLDELSPRPCVDNTMLHTIKIFSQGLFYSNDNTKTTAAAAAEDTPCIDGVRL